MIAIVLPAVPLCKLLAVGVVAARGYWEARKAGHNPVTALIWGACGIGVLLVGAWLLAD